MLVSRRVWKVAAHGTGRSEDDIYLCIYNPRLQDDDDRRNVQSQDCHRRQKDALVHFEATLLNNGFDTGTGALVARVATTGNLYAM